MFILFKDGRSVDVPTNRDVIADGIAIGYAQSGYNVAEQVVIAVSVNAVAGVFASRPVIYDPPPPPHNPVHRDE